MVHLTLLVIPNCTSCAHVLKQVESVQKIYPQVSLLVCSTHPRLRTAIVPALFVEDDLFSYGEINQERLLGEIQKREVVE